MDIAPDLSGKGKFAWGVREFPAGTAGVRAVFPPARGVPQAARARAAMATHSSVARNNCGIVTQSGLPPAAPAAFSAVWAITTSTASMASARTRPPAPPRYAASNVPPAANAPSSAVA